MMLHLCIFLLFAATAWAGGKSNEKIVFKVSLSNVCLENLLKGHFHGYFDRFSVNSVLESSLITFTNTQSSPA